MHLEGTCACNCLPAMNTHNVDSLLIISKISLTIISKIQWSSGDLIAFGLNCIGTYTLACHIFAVKNKNCKILLLTSRDGKEFPSPSIKCSHEEQCFVHKVLNVRQNCTTHDTHKLCELLKIRMAAT